MAVCSEYKRLLEPLGIWLEDGEISEIMINQPGQLYYEKAGCNACCRKPIPIIALFALCLSYVS